MDRVKVSLALGAAIPVQKPNLEQDQVREIREGIEKALKLLYAKYSTSLQGIIFRTTLSQETSEDAPQETFVKIWKNITYFNPEKGKLFTWMASLARNSAIDHLRGKNIVKSKMNERLEDCYLQLNSNSRCIVQLNTDTIGLKSLTFKLPKKQLDIMQLVFLKDSAIPKGLMNLTFGWERQKPGLGCR